MSNQSEEMFLCDALITHVHKADKAKRTKDRRAWLKTAEGRKWRNNDAAEWMRRSKGQSLKVVECVTCGTSFKQTATDDKNCDSCRRTDRIRRVWHETINPYVVFERDSWTCQHCGKVTPESLRGTLDDLAPELDHILPVAFNGAHSYFNTQCLCRKCNSIKGEHSEREPKLIGVADLAPYKTAKHPPLVGDRKEQLCACGCGESFVPSHSNLTGCKHGHWYRSAEGRTKADRESLGWTQEEYERLLQKTSEPSSTLDTTQQAQDSTHHADSSPDSLRHTQNSASQPVASNAYSGGMSPRERVRCAIWGVSA